MKKLTLLLIVAMIAGSCSHNVAKIDNSLKKYFDAAGVEGSFALMNNQKGEVTVYNLKADTQRVSPGSMFKIVGALIGLEAQRVTGKNSTLGAQQDTALAGVTLEAAFEENNTTYIDALMQKIGKDTLAFWLDSLHYGNIVMNTLPSFWNNGELKISPDEQMGLLTKIYFDKLPFQKYAQSVVRDLMLKEDNTKYRLSYTSGTSTGNTGEPIGWAAGWIEENQHVYFFTTTATSNEGAKDLDKAALKIAMDILKDKDYFSGNK